MKKQIITTADGSTSILIDDWQETYHSKNGAIQEAYHVFIKHGLELFEGKNCSILEIGFGTGLNAFITFLESQKASQKIDFVTVEAYPISAEEVVAMNFVKELNAENNQESFDKIHQCNWEEKIEISENFSLTKRQQFFQDINDVNQFDLIYFDAFGYRVQPELWSAEIFKIMYKSLKTNGILVTYAARGVIKRNMVEAGFSVEKLPGAPGKREMMRGRK